MSGNRTRFWYETHRDTIRFDYYGGYLINFPVGVDTLAATVSTVKNVDGVGSDVQTAEVPERPISISGYIVAAESSEEVRRLHRAFAPLQAGRLYTETSEHQVFIWTATPPPPPRWRASGGCPSFWCSWRRATLIGSRRRSARRPWP